MDRDDASLYFKQVSLFADLADEDIRQLMAAAKKRTFRPGEVIFHRDDVGQVLYVIKEGKVRTYDMMRISGGAKSLSQGAVSTNQMTDAILAKLSRARAGGATA